MLPTKEREFEHFDCENASLYAHFWDAFSQVQKEFHKGQPFPHIVIDDCLPKHITSIIEEYGRNLKHKDPSIHLNSKKYAKHQFWEFDSNMYSLLSWFYSKQFLELLEKITKIQGLYSDPEFNHGGGFHVLPNEGFLNVHKDFNTHSEHPKFYRRLNFILYLNPDWDDTMGGQLELWSRENNEPIESIIPKFNRCVIFETNHEAYHGNPNPVKSKSDRLSFATFYYTLDNSHLIASNETNAQILPQTTLYIDTPGTRANAIRKYTNIVKPFIPAKLIQYLKKKFY